MHDLLNAKALLPFYINSELCITKQDAIIINDVIKTIHFSHHQKNNDKLHRELIKIVRNYSLGLVEH